MDVGGTAQTVCLYWVCDFEFISRTLVTETVSTTSDVG
jgi:hypothetical protein